MTRTSRTLAALTVIATGLLVAAPAALAADGEGLWGRTDDKVITFFCFAVIAFFAIIVCAFSLLQARLEGRKERARSELERLRRP